MPFTAAHPAAVLALIAWPSRSRLDATCLVVGSMAPDIEYFARGRLLSTVAHSFPGFILWGVPVTLACAALYHWRLKWLLLLSLPPFIARRLGPLIYRPWKRRWTWTTLFIAALSAALGSLTHVVWDAFTHASGWPVRHYAILREQVLGPLTSLPLYRLLQHTSTLVGMALLVLAMQRRFARVDEVESPAADWRYLWGSLAIAGSCIAAMLARHALAGSLQIGNVVVATLSGALVGWTAAALAFGLPIHKIRRSALLRVPEDSSCPESRI